MIHKSFLTCRVRLILRFNFLISLRTLWIHLKLMLFYLKINTFIQIQIHLILTAKRKRNIMKRWRLENDIVLTCSCRKRVQSQVKAFLKFWNGCENLEITLPLNSRCDNESRAAATCIYIIMTRTWFSLVEHWLFDNVTLQKYACTCKNLNKIVDTTYILASYDKSDFRFEFSATYLIIRRRIIIVGETGAHITSKWILIFFQVWDPCSSCVRSTQHDSDLRGTLDHALYAGNTAPKNAHYKPSDHLPHIET